MYKVYYSPIFIKNLTHLKKQDALYICNYLESHIEKSVTFREKGKLLKCVDNKIENQLWCFMIGKYKIICEVRKHIVIALTSNVRKSVYINSES